MSWSIVPRLGRGLGVFLLVIFLAAQVRADDPFIRSDANLDGLIDVADAIKTLGVLFLSESTTCLDALDANDDGALDVADPIYSLTYQFSMGPAPHAPFPGCGSDPTPDPLGCAADATCAPLQAPCQLTYSETIAVYGLFVPISPNIPSWLCGNPDQFTIAPALPPGLVIDGATGIITGTPTAEQPITAYTVTATNPNGSADTTIIIQIAPVFTYSGPDVLAPFDTSTGIASFDWILLVEEEASGSPASFHEILGLSAGVIIDPLLLAVVAANPGPDVQSVNGGLGPVFFQSAVESNGVSVAMILDVTVPFDTLVADLPLSVLLVEFVTNSSGLVGSTTPVITPIEFGELGTPPIGNAVELSTSAVVLPRLIPSTVELEPSIPP